MSAEIATHGRFLIGPSLYMAPSAVSRRVCRFCLLVRQYKQYWQEVFSMPRVPQTAKASTQALVLDVPVPEGTDPALLPSLRRSIEQAVRLMVSSGEVAVIRQADELAGLLTGLIKPELGLVEERLHRLQTIREIFNEEEWLTAEVLNRLQPNPPSNKSL